jgi:DNA replication and repair protein RecF
MHLKNLNLKNFRLFKEKKISFDEKVSLIIGPNASGKTNILEAIYLLATGKSFRALKEEEMIKNGKELARIEASLNGDELEILLTRGEVQGRKTARKLYKINGVGKRWKDFTKNLLAVLFRPEDIDLISGSPFLRRNYLDLVLEQTNWQYRAASLTYQKGVRQRNKLLSKIREGEANPAQLTFWNQLLIKNGSLLTEKRQELIDFYNNFLNKCDRLYQEKRKVVIIYDKSIISQTRLDKYKQAELGAGVTLVGPHRDDLSFQFEPCSHNQKQSFKNSRNLTSYGSRGEQRMAVFALKLAEVEFILKKTQKRPVLLLDDIFSELDAVHKDHILTIIPKQQTIITTTDEDLVDKNIYTKIKKIKFS